MIIDVTQGKSISNLIVFVSHSSIFYIKRKCCNRENFHFPVFDGFTRSGCPEHNLTISGKCLSACLCVCDKNFVASVAKELKNRISRSFIFCVILT